jgi:hypothetical protein
VALFVWVVLMGSGLGFLWASVSVYGQSLEHLLALTASDQSEVKVITKYAAWNLLYPQRERKR